VPSGTYWKPGCLPSTDEPLEALLGGDPVLELQLGKQRVDLRVGRQFAGGIQNMGEYEAITKDAGKKMPVVIRRIRDRLFIDQYLAALRSQQTAQQQHQGRFAASVTAGKENHLSTPKLQINGTYARIRLCVGQVSIADIF